MIRWIYNLKRRLKMGKLLAADVQDKAVAVTKLAQYCRNLNDESPAFGQIAEQLTRSAEWLATISAQMSGTTVKGPEVKEKESADKLRELLQAISLEVYFFEGEGITLDSPVKVPVWLDGAEVLLPAAKRLAHPLNRMKMELGQG
jgi:hypothetical protein